MAVIGATVSKGVATDLQGRIQKLQEKQLEKQQEKQQESPKVEPPGKARSEIDLSPQTGETTGLKIDIKV